MAGRRVGLRARFMVTSALFVMATLAATGWTLVVLSRLVAVTSEVVRDTDDTTAATSALATALEREDDAVLVLLGGSRSAADPLADARAHTDAARDRLRLVLAGGDEERAVGAIDAAIEAYRGAVDRLVVDPGPTPLERYHVAANPRLREAVGSVVGVRDRHFERAAHAAAVAAGEVSRTRGIVAVIAAVSLVLSLLVALRLAQRVIGPLRELGRGALRIREGDFDARVEVAPADEIGELGAAFNEMAARLAEFRRSDLGAVLKAKGTLEATLRALPDPVIVVDPDGVVASSNPAAEALFERIGRPLPREVGDLVLIGLDRACIEKTLRERPVAERVDLAYALRVSLDDGERRLLPRVVPTSAGENGNGGIVVVLIDVTDLARLDEMRAELVAVASHQLRTPVTTLRMALLMLGEAAADLEPRVGELVANALGGVDQLRETVDELLDLTRIEAGRLELEVEPVDLVRLVQERLERCRQRADELGVRIELVGDGDVIRVTADRLRLRVVLDNVLDNALAYTQAGGHIVIEVGRDRDALAGEARARVAVTDSGPGVPTDLRKRIFEKFFRVEHVRPARGRGPRGSGIGLFLCKQIVELHGGAIRCEEGAAGGARIVVELPAVPLTLARAASVAVGDEAR